MFFIVWLSHLFYIDIDKISASSETISRKKHKALKTCCMQSERLRFRRRDVAVETEQGDIPYAYGSHMHMMRFDAQRISASFGT